MTALGPGLCRTILKGQTLVLSLDCHKPALNSLILYWSTMLTLSNLTWLDIGLAGIGAYLLKQVFTKKNPAPYPPGPRGWPLIGNISDMPHVKPWLAFTE